MTYLDTTQLLATRAYNPQELTDQVMLYLASFDDHSTFAMHYEDIQTTNVQTALKSVFAFDDILLCLGSNINNGNGINTVQTTLFQTSLSNPSDPNYINGTTQTGLSTNFSQTGGSLWCTDAVGNGFVIPASTFNTDDFHLKRVTQTSKEAQNLSTTTGDFVTAWIDHGASPSNESYQYAIKIRGGTTGTAALATNFNTTFDIIQQDNLAHIVKYVPESIYSLAIYDAVNYVDTTGDNANFIAINQPGVVMLQESDGGNTLKLSVTNPDLGILDETEIYSISQISFDNTKVFRTPQSRTITVMLKGTDWEFASNPYGADASISVEFGSTLLTFQTLHSKTMQVTLEKTPWE